MRARKKLRLETERLTLRAPIHSDFHSWSALRHDSEAYLTPWEPSWNIDHLSRRAFTNRVYWAQRSMSGDTALPLFIFRRADQQLVGAITIDNIRRGPAQAATVGYWTGQSFARQGFMREALTAVVHHAFHVMDLSRIEAACLPENTPVARPA
jgi:ribosomal-protein-alanine N-acetyltransferase